MERDKVLPVLYPVNSSKINFRSFLIKTFTATQCTNTAVKRAKVYNQDL